MVFKTIDEVINTKEDIKMVNMENREETPPDASNENKANMEKSHTLNSNCLNQPDEKNYVMGVDMLTEVYMAVEDLNMPKHDSNFYSNSSFIVSASASNGADAIYPTTAHAFDNLTFEKDESTMITQNTNQHTYSQTNPHPSLNSEAIKYRRAISGTLVQGMSSDKNCENVEPILWISNDDSADNIDTDLEREDSEKDKNVQLKVSSGPKIGNRIKIILMVCNCFMIILPIGILFASGILFTSIIEEFQSTRAEASPILSIFTAILFGCGGLFGPLMNRFNGGYLCIIGGILAFLGCIISYFAPSILVLVIGFSFLTGFGLSAPFLLPFIIVGELFQEKTATMLTIISICPGFSAVIFPYLTAQLLGIFGWRGVLLIYGAVLLNCVPIGLLNAYVKRRLGPTLGTGSKTNWRDIMNLSLLRKPEFMVVVFCIFLLNTLFPTINLFFVDFVREKGFGLEIGSSLLSINGFTSLSARILSIFVTPYLKCTRMTQWAVYLLIVSLTISMYVVFDKYEYLLATAIVHGFFWGFTIVSYPAMLLEIAGHKRYANAFGYCNLVGGISGLFGGPVAGLIKDATGSYDLVYYSTTVLGIIASILLAFVLIRKNNKLKRERNKETPIFVDKFTYIKPLSL